MCGIAGLAGASLPGLAARMNRAQKHRGPDGEGVFEDLAAEISLAHVRLAILDLSPAGHQPMFTPDERYAIVFNGEIYNFRELRAELESDGLQFRSTSDTEVLLQGLATRGEAFLERLNGIYAFALWDKETRELLLARDPLGVKPLYYAEPRPGTLVFASEIKALCAHPDVERRPDFTAIQQHIFYSYASGEQTVLSGVKRLAPGTLLRWRARTRTTEPKTFWSPRYDSANGLAREEAVGTLRQKLEAAVTRQLVSDVPVGVFLSGGLDSSLVTALAARSKGTGLECYTLVYPDETGHLDQGAADLPFARSLARELGLTLREVELPASAAASWPDVIAHLDEPLVDPAALSCLLIARAARERKTPVLLSGQGADELFCGYPRYIAFDLTQYLDHLPRFVRTGLSRTAHALPGSYGGRMGLLSRRVRRALESARLEPDTRFLSFCATSPEAWVKRILSPELREKLAQQSPGDACLAFMRRRGLSGWSRYIDRDLSIYLPNHNLLYTDKACMAAGIEARVPLLDQEVVDFVNRLPAEWKFGSGTTKVLLREAARGIVPDAIIDRAKAGFGAPFRSWLKNDLAALWNELTSDAAIARRGWFDAKAVQEARRLSLAGREDLFMLQWAVLTLELWARRFLDADPSA